MVTSTTNAGPGSLRDAVACASAGQTVTISSSLANATINLSSQISITVPLAINGSAAPGVKVDGGGASRIFNIFAGGPEVNNRDQRGVTRPINGDHVPGAVCDIGAFEASAPVFYLYLPLVRR